LPFFTSYFFASYPIFCFISPEVKVNGLIERNKKYIARNIIVDKTKVKEKEVLQRGKKQKVRNKEHIVE